MKPSRAVIWLALLIAGLSLVASGAGLLWQDSGAPQTIVSPRGETVTLYGAGLYRYESLRNGAGFKGVDLFIILIAVPLLLVCTRLYRRGSVPGALLLTGTLAYFLYNALHLVFSYAYNSLFLIYLVLFSASLFATAIASASIDRAALPQRFSSRLPRRAIAAFLFAVGLALSVVWIGLSILPALLAGTTPQLSGYTTLVTHAVDVGVIAPLAVGAAVLLLRRAPLGYLLAAVLLVLSSVLGAGVAALSIAQLLAGTITPAETIVFVVPFVILTAVGITLTALLLRSFSTAGSLRAAYA